MSFYNLAKFPCIVSEIRTVVAILNGILKSWGQFARPMKFSKIAQMLTKLQHKTLPSHQKN